MHTPLGVEVVKMFRGFETFRILTKLNKQINSTTLKKVSSDVLPHSSNPMRHESEVGKHIPLELITHMNHRDGRNHV